MAFDIKPGEKVAVIGGIGSGKTTLLKLLAGLYAPSQGHVLLGGLELNQVAEELVRRHVGYVTQDARLVNGTLRDNLTMGLGEISDAEIFDVARRTRLESMIAARQEGLALPIQEGGRGLSGGQRALVGINRQLLSQPKVWLLDEPTASLDQNTELAVLDAVDAALDDRSIMVMVTHKIPLLTRFTRIIALAGGKVIKNGPAHEVLQDILPKGPPPGGGGGGGPAGTITSKLGPRKPKP